MPEQPSAQSASPAKTSASAIVALILGVVALLTSAVPIVNNLSAILAVIGAVFAIVGLVGISRGKRTGRGLAIASLFVNVIAVVIVIALQSIFVAAVDSATEDMGSVSSQVADASSADAEQAKYVVADEAVDESNAYSTYINGAFTNNSGDEMGYVSITYTLFDTDGNQVGTAYASTNNLKDGATWKFEAIGTASPDEVASFERAEVTTF